MILTLMPCAMGALRLHVDGFIFTVLFAYFVFTIPFVIMIGLFYDYRRTLRVLVLLDKWGRKVLAPRIGL